MVLVVWETRVCTGLPVAFSVQLLRRQTCWSEAEAWQRDFEAFVWASGLHVIRHLQEQQGNSFTA